MSKYLIDKHDANRILSDASIAIDMLERVKKECYKTVVFSTYIKEKATVARECVDFILSVAEEIIKEAEQNDTV